MISVNYLATTRREELPEDQIFMVDGTVPQWQPRPGDYHWDHHRLNGAAIQIEEMLRPSSPEQSLLDQLAIANSLWIVTTMVDADACVAAAWLQLPGRILNNQKIVNYLRAIAYDCDHLGVPESLTQLKTFAANAVATLKLNTDELARQSGLPPQRQQWSERDRIRFGALSFQVCTEWLITAAKGEKPWPGQQGEAARYWEKVAQDRERLLQEGRVQILKGVAVFDLRGLETYIDPRSCLQTLDRYDRPETLTIHDHRQGGLSYTLGCIPQHPKFKKLNYLLGAFDRLRAAEADRLGEQPQDSWGGRATVGGSSWNTPSLLSPEEVIALL